MLELLMRANHRVFFNVFFDEGKLFVGDSACIRVVI